MLFVGDDWAEEHHDIEIVDETGRVLARKRPPEGLVGMTRLHELLGKHVCQLGRPGPGRGRGERAGGDPDRPWPVGGRDGRGRLPGVRDQPAVGGPVARGGNGRVTGDGDARI